MTFNAMQFNRHMFNGMSASFAQANGSCADSAAMQCTNTAAMILDAGILASIIICSMILGVTVRLCTLSLLVLVLAVVVLAVLLVVVKLDMHLPDVRRRA